MLGEAVALIGLQPSEYRSLTLGERNAIFDVYRKAERERSRRYRR